MANCHDFNCHCTTISDIRTEEQQNANNYHHHQCQACVRLSNSVSCWELLPTPHFPLRSHNFLHSTRLPVNLVVTGGAGSLYFWSVRWSPDYTALICSGSQGSTALYPSLLPISVHRPEGFRCLGITRGRQSDQIIIQLYKSGAFQLIQLSAWELT